MLAPTPGPASRDLFDDMTRLHAEMDRLFGGGLRGTLAAGYPPVNLWAGDDAVVLTAEVPGLSREDIELTVHEDTLTLRGERRTDTGEHEPVWHRRERPAGRFARTVRLPFRIDADRVEARVHNGVLVVEMQRPEEDRPRRIAIRSG